MNEMKCGGVITETTTKAGLLDRGFREEAACEVLTFRDYLALKNRRLFTEGDVHDLDIVILDEARIIPNTHLDRIRNLRDRISALLPHSDGSWREA